MSKHVPPPQGPRDIEKIDLKEALGTITEDERRLRQAALDWSEQNPMLGIRGVRLAVFFEELPDGKVRVSMRSKDKRLDVCQIATRFGGGGHALAAGIRMKGPWDQAKALVLSAIREKVDEVIASEG